MQDIKSNIIKNIEFIESVMRKYGLETLNLDLFISEIIKKVDKLNHLSSL